MPNIQLMKLFDSYLGPASDTLLDLGATIFRWNNAYIYGTLSASTISNSSSNISVLTVINTGFISYQVDSIIRLQPVATPSVADSNIWNDSIQRTIGVQVNSRNSTISNVLYSATTNKVITNTTAETTILSTSSVGSLMLPPSYMTPGKLLRLKGGGVYSTPLTPGSAQIVLRLGGSSLASFATSSFLGSASSAGFAFESHILCQTSGSTGKFSTAGNFNYQGALGVNTIRVFDDLDADGTATTINSTTHLLIELTAQWDTIDSGKTINVIHSSVEVLN